jgi:hypothetical protein
MMNHFARLAPIARAAAGAAVLTLGAMSVAMAQPAPPMNAAPPPSYAAPVAGGDEQITGHISAITGKYTLQVRDNRGYLDNVTLHQGTIINPTGLTLAPGMQVTISGINAGSSFAANEINTPYTVALVQPLYPGYGYGYGGFGFGWGGFGWGPRYRLGFGW